MTTWKCDMKFTHEARELTKIEFPNAAIEHENCQVYILINMSNMLPTSCLTCQNIGHSSFP